MDMNWRSLVDYKWWVGSPNGLVYEVPESGDAREDRYAVAGGAAPWNHSYQPVLVHQRPSTVTLQGDEDDHESMTSPSNFKVYKKFAPKLIKEQRSVKNWL